VDHTRQSPWQPDQLRAELEQAGFDIVESRLGLRDGGGSLVARRDRGDRVEMISLDAGGRFRLTVTAVVGESSRAATVAGRPVRVVETVRRESTVAGTLDDPGQLEALVSFAERLDRAAPRVRGVARPDDEAPLV
jgi:hypothetical protein